jgi:hypothetical protein
VATTVDFAIGGEEVMAAVAYLIAREGEDAIGRGAG